MPRGNGSNRQSLSGVTLPPEQIDRLAREEDERTIGKSKLVEKAVGMLFDSFDAKPAETPAPAPKPGPNPS